MIVFIGCSKMKLKAEKQHLGSKGISGTKRQARNLAMSVLLRRPMGRPCLQLDHLVPIKGALIQFPVPGPCRSPIQNPLYTRSQSLNLSW
jgi:hypothetical protein